MSTRQSEIFNENTRSIDSLSTIEIVKLINEEDQKIAHAVKEAIPAIVKLSDQATEIINNGGKIIYIGSGTSGDLASNDAQEIQPTYGVPFGTFRAIHLQLGPNLNFNDNKELIISKRDGSEDGQSQIIEDLKSINFSKKDMVIGISVSGTTDAIIKALKWSKNMGATTACIVMNENSPMAQVTDFQIIALTGPEVISGSTRMKGGTATKMILNMISTTTMIKCGHVYKGLMVGLSMPKEGNSKFLERGSRIIQEITGVNKEHAKKLYINANYDIKSAIVSKIKNINISDAKNLLKEHNNNLQKILG